MKGPPCRFFLGRGFSAATDSPVLIFVFTLLIA